MPAVKFAERLVGRFRMIVCGGQVAPGNVTSIRLRPNLTAGFTHETSGCAPQ